MLTTPPSRWAVHGAAFAAWVLAAAAAVYWGLKLSAPAASRPAAAPARAAAAADPAAIVRLLGSNPAAPAAAPAQPSLASRFALLGIAAQGDAGVALISVDGKPPKPYRVGSQVEHGLVLQSVQARRALLGPADGAQAALTLDLPPLRR
jgi:general secretion pathway protein C